MLCASISAVLRRFSVESSMFLKRSAISVMATLREMTKKMSEMTHYILLSFFGKNIEKSLKTEYNNSA